MQSNTTASRFIGTKLIRAQPMTRGEYNHFRGWTMPADEQADEAGYLVEYLDGGKGNLPTHEGYVTWTPKEPFDAAYRACDALNFGLAVEAMKRGHKVARAGWTGAGQWVALGKGNDYLAASQFWNEHARAHAEANGGGAQVLPYFILKTAQGAIMMGWSPSQSDALADDWQIIDGTETKTYADGVKATGPAPLPNTSPADTSEAAIEREIQAKGLTAPRLSPDDLTANIAHSEIVRHVSHSGQVLRWAILTAQNGFAVVGKPSVAVSPENDNAEIGEKVAIENSRTELWPLMGYALKQKLHDAACEHALLHGEVAG